MRVISGSAKGHPLKAVPGDSTRPVTDRVKEALFDILADDVIGARVLDLFAGTGGIGIEALSRGAAHAVFLDTERAAIATIRANLQTCKLLERARVLKLDAFQYLRQAPPAPFDLIYIAPPQYREMWTRALLQLDTHPASWLTPQGVIVTQIHPREFETVALQKLTCVDERKYGTTLLNFYEPIGAPPAPE